MSVEQKYSSVHLAVDLVFLGCSLELSIIPYYLVFVLI